MSTKTDQLKASDEPFKWICKIETSWPDKKNTRGTGFLVNIPRVAMHCIMTAGHNLVKSSKAPNDPVIRPAAVTLTFPGKKAPYTTKPEQWKVNEIYERNPVDENAVHDYALIAVDMNETAIERGGFAYTLRVTEEVIIHSQVHVYGYRANMQPGEELHPEGNKGWARVRGNQILYGIATEGGVSGGPVWIRHRTGDDTVVGIHNYGEDKAKGEKEKEKRAVWLTLEVLEQMLKWIKYPGLSQSVQLMFRDQKIPTPSNYFLCAPKMPSNPPRQWYTVFSARGTSDTSDTKFTFIPIEAPPYQKSTDTGYQGRHIYIIRPQGTSFLLASKGDGLAFTSHKHTNEQAWFVLEKYGEVHEIYEILKKGGWNEENYLNLNIDCGEIRTRRPEELQCRHLNRLIPNVKLMKPKSVSGGTKPDVRFEIK